ncbi:MAG: hypothetical protein Ta2F_16780 [Termitinemataceae bacterium]|nr:MAG: hypothetical protein Ta2F_16780 [Termitinemataceae bacterium]
MAFYEFARDTYRKLIPARFRWAILPLVLKLMQNREDKSEVFGPLYKRKYKRQHYFYCVYQAAKLAKKLGLKSVSVMEFGVAGGNGIIALEKHANVISEALDINIEVYGFDTGMGLPTPADYRDLPYLWQKGFYKMDIEKLQKRLTNAKLVIGNISETSKTFFDKYKPAPIGAVVFDMDFYTSTIAAFDLFEGDDSKYLPRIFTYFDDIFVKNISDYTGERLAISEFNHSHKNKKFSLDYGLLYHKKIELWYSQIFILHFFEHSEYNTFVEDIDVGSLSLH